MRELKAESLGLRVSTKLQYRVKNCFACRLTGLPAYQQITILFFISLFFTFHFSLPTVFAAEVHSRAATVIDASTGKILYAKNPDLKCAPASTTKLMTAILALENTNLNDVVTISRNASNVPPHKAGFKEGDKVSVEKLLYAALLGSANDAAVALGEAVAGSEAKFVEMMNSKALSIGAKDTRFINANGLPGPGQYITASDLSKIMTYALRYPKLKEIIGTRVAEISTQNGRSIFLRNTNRLLWSDDELVGGKTGFTRKAMHCFACAAERQNETVVVALLGSPSRTDLWKESEILIEKGFEIMGNKLEPVVYLTKINDEPGIETAVYKRHSKHRVHSADFKDGKRMLSKKAVSHKKTNVLAKKKSRTKVAKSRSKKNYRIAERGGIDRIKG